MLLWWQIKVHPSVGRPAVTQADDPISSISAYEDAEGDDGWVVVPRLYRMFTGRHKVWLLGDKRLMY